MKKTNYTDNFLTTGPMNRVILTISVPLMLNNLVRTLFNLTDGLFVAQISAIDFSATAFVWPLNFLFIAIGLGIGIGSTALIAQMIGAKQGANASRYAHNAVLMTFVIGFIMSSLGYFLSPSMLSWMGARGELLEKSIIYLQISYLGLFFDFTYFGFQAILNAQGQTKVITQISILSSVTNIILDPIFIFKRIDFLHINGLGLGISGAAWATVLSKLFLLFLIIWQTHRRSSIRFSFRRLQPDIETIKVIAKIAAPTAVGYCGSAMGFTILNGFIQSYGTTTLAAYSMVNRVTDLLTQPQMGVGGALTSIIGQNMGAQLYDRAHKIFNRAMTIILVTSVISCILVIIFKYQLLGIFIKDNSNPELWRLAIEYLYYSAFIIFFMGMFSAYIGFFQGCGQTKYSMYMTIGRLWCLRLPIIWLLKTFANLGPSTVWIAMLLSNCLIVVFGFLVYRHNDWTALAMGNSTDKS